MRKRVLVVGDDPAFWQELKQLPPEVRQEWNFDFARTGLEALAALTQTQHTAVVANLRMAGMSGIQLLDEVLLRQPQSLRFIRAPFTDQEAMLRCLGTTHQFLLQPTESQTLVAALKRALSLECWLPGDAVRRLASSLRKVPSPPELYFEVVRELQSPLASLDDVGRRIERDPAMTAKLLQLVNSAVFGLQLQVSDPVEAVMYLGIETTKSLILVAHTYSYFDDLPAGTFSVDSLWQHSLSTAQCAQWIAEAEGASPETIGASFTAGLLHDFGKLLLAANVPREFSAAAQDASSNHIELWQAEQRILGTHHGEVGACILAIWGIPTPIVEAVALHHKPARLFGDAFSPLVAVHVANVLAQTTSLGQANYASPALDLEYLGALGFGDHLADWARVIAAQSETAASVG